MSSTSKTLIVANWKMNLNMHEASTLLHRLTQNIKTHRNIEIVLAPNALCVQPLSLELDHRKFRLAAQNGYQKDEGPFTGEISFSMLRDFVQYAIIGHSDRRYKFGEDLTVIREKVSAAIRNGITPILCVGETETERKLGETRDVLQEQVLSALRNLASPDIETMVIAYEPVWALSSGRDYMHHATPKPDDIQKAVTLIRNNISQLYGQKAAERVRVLYGGSSNASNAHGLLSIEGVDGLLVGGASLNYQEFTGITTAAERLHYAKQDK